MDGWKPIETAPKDGSVVRVRRVCPSGYIMEGDAVWGVLHDKAPSRSGPGIDPLGRMGASDYAREAADIASWSAQEKWLKPDRMYAFPTPTHWRAV